ncbi:MAG TPA: DUF1653 domain-containing protein [Candidatus Paceibacterota bacterium]
MFKVGLYRHYKGNIYKVLGLAKHTETLEELVVYGSLNNEGELWVRPLSLFLGTTKYQGKVIPRFEYLGERLSG